MKTFRFFFEKTKAMSKKAKKEHRNLACLWLRAISPYMPDKQSNTVEIHEAALWITERFDEVLLDQNLDIRMAPAV